MYLNSLHFKKKKLFGKKIIINAAFHCSKTINIQKLMYLIIKKNIKHSRFNVPHHLKENIILETISHLMYLINLLKNNHLGINAPPSIF